MVNYEFVLFKTHFDWKIEILNLNKISYHLNRIANILNICPRINVGGMKS